MTKVYIASNNLPLEIIRFHTVGFSDILSRIRNSTTTCLSRTVHFGRWSFRPLNCTISCYYVARKVGTSANSALIRYYVPRLKLSSSTLALARDRTPSRIKNTVLKKLKQTYCDHTIGIHYTPNPLQSQRTSMNKTIVSKRGN